jgi:competence ComEA-like helix-hairpin-helix protein
MGLYTRQQLMLVLLLLGAAGVGLAVVHWRAAHPDLVERLEQVERELADPEDPSATGVGRAGDNARVARPPERRSSGDERSARGPRAPKRRPAPPEEPSAPLDLNRASLADLTRLPGVGPVLAQRILDTRDVLERFGAVDDLARVRGLGHAKLERLRPFVAILE